MKCLHCLVEFHPKEFDIALGNDVDGGWVIRRLDCPACERMNLYLLNCKPMLLSPIWHHVDGFLSSRTIRPKGTNRPPCPPEIPAILAEDYNEACLVLSDSPKASAALSRRCLQNLLRAVANVNRGDLANEIQQVIDSGQLPSDLAENIDAIRQIGNFAAHPVKSTSTGEILPVEPHEAEWSLEVLESLFDFYYVQPAIRVKKRAALNAKLAEAGKPLMK